MWGREEGGEWWWGDYIFHLHSPLSPSLPPLVPPPPLFISTHHWCCNPTTLQPLLFNTLQVRSALGSTHRRKLSFKNVSNVVVQLLHSIKYSMEVPFSNMAIPPQEKSTSITKKVRCLTITSMYHWDKGRTDTMFLFFLCSSVFISVVSSRRLVQFCFVWL